MKVLVALFLLICVTNDVYAATFGDMFNSLGQQVLSFGGLLKIAFPVGGFYCIGYGLYLALGQPYGTSSGNVGLPGMTFILWILAGACLLAISGFALMSSESMGLSGGSIDF